MKVISRTPSRVCVVMVVNDPVDQLYWKVHFSFGPICRRSFEKCIILIMPSCWAISDNLSIYSFLFVLLFSSPANLELVYQLIQVVPILVLKILINCKIVSSPIHVLLTSLSPLSVMTPIFFMLLLFCCYKSPSHFLYWFSAPSLKLLSHNLIVPSNLFFLGYNWGSNSCCWFHKSYINPLFT